MTATESIRHMTADDRTALAIAAMAVRRFRIEEAYWTGRSETIARELRISKRSAQLALRIVAEQLGRRREQAEWYANDQETTLRLFSVPRRD